MADAAGRNWREGVDHSQTRSRVHLKPLPQEHIVPPAPSLGHSVIPRTRGAPRGTGSQPLRQCCAGVSSSPRRHGAGLDLDLAQGEPSERHGEGKVQRER